MRKRKSVKSESFKVCVNKLGLVELDVSGQGLSQLPTTDIFNFQRVESINGSDNSMSFLPTIIGNLRRLQILDIHNNNVNKLPDTICNCERLKYLDASDNCLDSLPAAIYNLKNLKYLRLAGNKFRFLGEELTWVKSLEYLDISRNQLQIIPYGMQELTRLQVLDLSQNRITTLPSHICKLKHLISLNLNGNQLSTLPTRITQWTKLKELNLSHNKYTEIPEQVSDLRALTYLNMAHNLIRVIPGRLERLPYLNTLHLEYNQLTTLNYLPRSLLYLNSAHNSLHIVSTQGLVNLRCVECSHNQLEYLPLGLSDCLKVESVFLGNNRIKEVPNEITRMKELKILNLENNDIEVLPSAINEMRQLQKFSIQGNKFNARKPVKSEKKVKEQDEGALLSTRWFIGERRPVKYAATLRTNDVKQVGNSTTSPRITQLSDVRQQSSIYHCVSSPLSYRKTKSTEDLRFAPESIGQMVRYVSAAGDLMSNTPTVGSQPATLESHQLNPNEVEKVCNKRYEAEGTHSKLNSETTNLNDPTMRTDQRKAKTHTCKHQEQQRHTVSCDIPRTTIDDLLNQIDTETSSVQSDIEIKDSFTVTSIGGRFASSEVPQVIIEFPPGAVDRAYSFCLQVEVYPQITLEKLKQAVSNSLLDTIIHIGAIAYITSNDYLPFCKKEVTVYLPIIEPDISGYIHVLSYMKDNVCIRPPGPYKRENNSAVISLTHFSGGLGAVITRNKSTNQSIEAVEEFLKLIYV